MIALTQESRIVVERIISAYGKYGLRFTELGRITYQYKLAYDVLRPGKKDNLILAAQDACLLVRDHGAVGSHTRQDFLRLVDEEPHGVTLSEMDRIFLRHVPEDKLAVAIIPMAASMISGRDMHLSVATALRRLLPRH